jgi:3-deoxy-D-manno-octulosonic acid (KDO) 8-phosphate synthase
LQDNKELQKNLAESVKGQVKPDDMTSIGDKATKSNNEKVVVADERPASFGSQSQENIPNSLEEVCL